MLNILKTPKLALAFASALLIPGIPVTAQAQNAEPSGIVEKDGERYEVLEERFEMHFRWDKTKFDPEYLTNAQELSRLDSFLGSVDKDRIEKIEMYSYASPEGVYEHNIWLSEGRSRTMKEYFASRYPDWVSKLTVDPRGESWDELRGYVEKDTQLSEKVRTAILDILDSDINVGTKKWRLERLGAYRYLYRTYYPLMRNTGMLVVHLRPVEPEPVPEPEPVVEPEPEPEPVAEAAPVIPEKKPFYMWVKTNMVYDALLVPNIGVEFYLGKNWSIGGNWMYQWIKTDKKHDYWRIYGGDLHVSKWFGKAADEKPLTGHHVGLYGGIVTYDFELGHRGYLGPKWSYGGGVEYGYSMPIGRRLNLDFTIGLGYLGGKYYEYLPIDQCYVWQATKHRNFIGPTKVEVNLVWLLGRGNVNKKYVKGGSK